MAKKGRSFVCSLACVMWLATPTQSEANQPSSLCEASAIEASRASGVPLSVLRAIALTETGRLTNGRLEPWPWTVNMEGKGTWFKDRNAAIDYAERHMERSAVSFDIGCFQINYKWHGDAFRSVAHMFEPEANAHYAARFLAELYDEFGNWTLAAGAYHSRTPKYANRYRRRFAQILEELEPINNVELPVQRVAADVGERNDFPLLVPTRSPTGLASLVPLSRTANARFIDISGQ